VIAPELLKDILPSGAPDVGNVRKSGWISDALLWETTLGMREDEEAELALAPEKAIKPKAAPVKEDKPQSVTKHVAKKAKPARQNPNASTFAARDVGENGPISQSVSQRVEMPAVERGSSMVKKLIIGASIAVVAAIGVGVYVMTSDEETQLPGAITELLDKAKTLGSDDGNAENIKKQSVKSKSSPKLTATELKINKERVEMNSRNAAQVEFSRLKKKAPVISQSGLVSDASVENEVVLSKPVVSDAPAPGVNVLPTVAQEGVPAESDVPAASSVQSGDTADKVNAEAGDGKSVIEMTIDSIEQATEGDVKETTAADQLISE
jgi:hypothetical protein